jgi:GTPase
MEDINNVKNNIKSGKICPIFSVSNLEATGLDMLRYFLSILPKSMA